MLFAILAGLGVLFIVIWGGVVPPPRATTLLRIRNGQLHVARGPLRAQPREFISNIIAEASVAHGFIAILPENRVAFSWNIPAAVRQRVRNVLLNR